MMCIPSVDVSEVCWVKASCMYISISLTLMLATPNPNILEIYMHVYM